MRAFLTGGTGFIGSHLARSLVSAGWEIVALVRSPERAGHLREMGATLVGGDVTEPTTLASPMRRCDAVFHLAAWYAIGATDRQRMYEVNVVGTENVLTEAVEAGVGRIVVCSSVAAKGRVAAGEVVDEATRHSGEFASLYEETKWQAQRIAEEMAEAGLPIVVVLPGAVYGPADPSVVGLLFRFYSRGWLLAAPAFDGAFSWVHVEDVAAGMMLAHDKGRHGEQYILGGDNATVADLLRRVSPEVGIRPPRFRIPGWMMAAGRPLGPAIARILRQEPLLLEEGLASLKGSWMASSGKAQHELGYTYRSIEEGVPETIRWFKEH